MTVILYVHQKREDFPLSLYLSSQQGNTPLSLILLSILCFLTAFCCDVTSQLLSSKKGGASDKNTQTYTINRHVLFFGSPIYFNIFSFFSGSSKLDPVKASQWVTIFGWPGSCCTGQQRNLELLFRWIPSPCR